MRKFRIAGLLVAGFAGSALAAQQHFVVRDSSGYCAVIDAHPSKVAGLKTIGKASGYDSHETPPSRRSKPCTIAPARPRPEAS